MQRTMKTEKLERTEKNEITLKTKITKRRHLKTHKKCGKKVRTERKEETSPASMAQWLSVDLEV